MPRTALTFPRRKTVENMLTNGDFEYAPPFTAATNTTQRFIDGTASGSANNYSPYTWGFSKGNTATAQFDSTVSKFGTNSMKITTGSSAAYGEVNLYGPFVSATTKNTLIPALPNTTYTLSWWMKTEYVTGDASQGATVGLIEYNGVPASTTFNSGAGATIKTTTDWTFYSYSITTQSTTRFFNIQPRIYGHTGTATLQMNAWFDDFTVVKSPVQTRSTTNILRRKPVGGNIVYNGDFEILPATNTAMTSVGDKFIDGTASGSATDATYGWYVYNYTGTRSVQFDTTTKYQGNGSLKLTTNAGSVGVAYSANVDNDASWSRNNLPCEPNTTYNLSVWVKTNVISGSATTGAAVIIAERNKTNATVSGGGKTIVSGIITTTDWTQYTTTITTQASTRFLNPQFQLVGNNGTATLNIEAWYDNLTITQGIPRRDVDNLVFNGNFEYAPPFTAATTTAARWINGTSSGSSDTESPYGWRITGTSTAGFTARYDTTVYRSGVASLKLSTTDATGVVSAGNGNLDSDQNIRETLIPVLPNTSYTVNAWCKTNNVASGGARISILEYNSRNTTTATDQTNNISGTNDWTLLTRTFTTNSASSRIALVCRNNVAGNVSDAWFDDITLVKN